MTANNATTWQRELADECRKLGLPNPVYNVISDRRGGRTAWSCTVTVQGTNFAARFWYDGQFVNNAKEDCAEVACGRIRSPSVYRSQPRESNAGRSGWAR